MHLLISLRLKADLVQVFGRRRKLTLDYQNEGLLYRSSPRTGRSANGQSEPQDSKQFHITPVVAAIRQPTRTYLPGTLTGR
jgi:hypothetical protein